MVYSSLLFIYGFLPVSLLLYYVSPKKSREFILLLLSAVFCGMISLYFLCFMAVYVLVNYSIGSLIDKMKKGGMKAGLPLALGIVFDLTALVAFRTEAIPWVPELIKVPQGFFPIGISFFTLSSVGTLIDIYKGRIEAEKNFVRYALFIIFFPRLIMGPLMRYDVFRKVLTNRRCGLSELGIGFTVFIKGLAKKVIFADNLFMLYSAVKRIAPDELSALSAWLGAVAYLLCLYFTLSGISDMGTGIGYCFGLRFPQSFNHPMFSPNILYFTSRWHTQVVHWFRRYITKPFSSISAKKWQKKIIFIIAWSLLGIWYTFTLNGFISGLLIGAGILLENRFTRSRAITATGIFYTFFIVLLVSIFMSGDSISYSLSYLLAMIGGNRNLADTLSLYLFRNYIVMLLISLYASTNIFRNMINRSGKGRLRKIFIVSTPILAILLLTVCTAMMSYSGYSGLKLIKL